MHNYTPVDLDRAVAYLERVVAEDRYPLRELISPPFRLEHIQVQALEVSEHRKFQPSGNKKFEIPGVTRAAESTNLKTQTLA